MSQSLYARLSRRFNPQPVNLPTPSPHPRRFHRTPPLQLLLASAGPLQSRRQTHRHHRRRLLRPRCCLRTLSVGYQVPVLEARNRGRRTRPLRRLSPRKSSKAVVNYRHQSPHLGQLRRRQVQTQYPPHRGTQGLIPPPSSTANSSTKPASEKLYKEMDARHATINDAARDIDVEEPWKSKTPPGADAPVARRLALRPQRLHHRQKSHPRRTGSRPRRLLERQSFSPSLPWSKAAASKILTDSETGRACPGQPGPRRPPSPPLSVKKSSPKSPSPPSSEIRKSWSPPAPAIASLLKMSSSPSLPPLGPKSASPRTPRGFPTPDGHRRQIPLLP